MSRINTSSERRLRIGARLAVAPAAGGHTAPTFRSAAYQVTGSGNTSFNPTNPAGTASGDLLLILAHGQPQVTMSGTGGQTWTQLHNTGAGGNGFNVWWAIHNGSLGTITLNISGGSPTFGCEMIAITAGTFNASTPIDCTSGFQDASSTGGPYTIGGGGITPVTDNVLLIFGALVIAASNQITATPAGATDIRAAGQDGWIGNAYSLWVGRKVQASPGTTTETWNRNSGTHGDCAIAIRPA